MATYEQELSSSFASAHRYARAVAGDRDAGDWYLRIALETLVEEPSRIRAEGDVRMQVFKLVNEVFEACAPPSVRKGLCDEDVATGMPPKHGVEFLPLPARQMLLLVTEMRFSVRRAAELFGMSEREAEIHLAWALAQLRSNDPAEVSDLELSLELAAPERVARRGRAASRPIAEVSAAR